MACVIFFQQKDGARGCRRRSRALKRDYFCVQRIRNAVLRNEELLNGFIRYTNEEVGFFLRRRYGFCNDGQAGARRGGGNGIAAVEIVVATVLASRIARDIAHRLGNAQQIRICVQRDSACHRVAVVGGGFVGHRDIARHIRTGDASLCQPARVFQIFRWGLIFRHIEIIHIPIVADILRPFQLADHLTDGKLACNARPNIVVLIPTIQHHERIGMAQYPCDGMQGAILVHDGGIARGCAVGVDIHHLIWACRLIASIRSAFARAGDGVFQAIDDVAIQIVRRGVHRTFVVGFCNLRIITVPAGIAI